MVTALCFVGCKKPEVQVEEEGPPLPLPANGQATQGGPGLPGTVAGTNALPGVLAATEAVPQISDDDACKLVDAAMTMSGIAIKNRQCSHLVAEGDSVQLGRYFIPIKNTPALFRAYQFCLWPDEDSGSAGGWRVGYAQTDSAPCLTPDDYCKIGAPGAEAGIGAGCPGDESRTRKNEQAQWDALIGTWTAPNGDSLKLRKSGDLQWVSSSVRHAGSANRDGFGSGTLSTKPSAFSFGYAVMGDKARLGRGVVTASKTRESFYAQIGPTLAVRRFRGACYEITQPPKPFATPLVCSIEGSGDGATIAIKLTGQMLTLVRSGDFWIDGGMSTAIFERK
ncbi:MAG: hypothetical protein ACI9OJ_001999 [Myxococcota bacterium]|jgi:hypothetical protein